MSEMMEDPLDLLSNFASMGALDCEMDELKARLIEMFPDQSHPPSAHPSNEDSAELVEEAYDLLKGFKNLRADCVNSAIRLQLDIRDMVYTIGYVNFVRQSVQSESARVFALAELSKKLEYLREMLNVEYFVHAWAETSRTIFVIDTNLQGPEVDKLLTITELDAKMGIGCLSFVESRDQALAFVDKMMLAKTKNYSGLENETKDKVAEKTEGIINHADLDSQRGISSKAASASQPVTQAWPGVATCFTCGEEGHVAKDCLRPDFIEDPAPYHGNCQNCGMYGHDKEDCDTPISVQEPDTCDYCKKPGHHEDDCWRLYPELKKKYLEAQKKKEERRYCDECGAYAKPGCYRLHGKK